MALLCNQIASNHVVQPYKCNRFGKTCVWCSYMYLCSFHNHAVISYIAHKIMQYDRCVGIVVLILSLYGFTYYNSEVECYLLT